MILALAINLASKRSIEACLGKISDVRILASVNLLTSLRGTAAGLKTQLRQLPMGTATRALLSNKLGGALQENLAGLIDSGVFESFENREELLDKQQILKNLSMISSYRGNRLKLNMPVRGQRTHTNAKTRRKRKII